MTSAGSGLLKGENSDQTKIHGGRCSLTTKSQNLLHPTPSFLLPSLIHNQPTIRYYHRNVDVSTYFSFLLLFFALPIILTLTQKKTKYNFETSSPPFLTTKSLHNRTNIHTIKVTPKRREGRRSIFVTAYSGTFSSEKRVSRWWLVLASGVVLSSSIKQPNRSWDRLGHSSSTMIQLTQHASFARHPPPTRNKTPPQTKNQPKTQNQKKKKKKKKKQKKKKFL